MGVRGVMWVMRRSGTLNASTSSIQVDKPCGHQLKAPTGELWWNYTAERKRRCRGRENDGWSLTGRDIKASIRHRFIHRYDLPLLWRHIPVVTSHPCCDVTSLWWRHIPVVRSHPCCDVTSLLWRHIPVVTSHPCDVTSLWFISHIPVIY